MKIKKYTSESITIGHPDKVCDLISDRILDECIKFDNSSKVACEVMGTKNKIIIAGEITTNKKIDFARLGKEVLEGIGYNANEIEFEVLINEQSPDISQCVNKSMEHRVHKSDELENLQGAGDQGIMYGYASNENSNYIPNSYILARKLTDRLTFVRKQNIINGLLPDGKSQVTISVDNNNNVNILNILLSTQHTSNISLDNLRADIIKYVINYVFIDYNLDKTSILINPSGRFVVGGFEADTGLTGRKLQADSYGGISKQGGGAYSGKDPSKVDRSGAYMCRYIAKNIVGANICDKCEVSLAYAIGVANPIAFELDFFGTKKEKHYTESFIKDILLTLIDLRPSEIVKKLMLLQPIYFDTTINGHFGNNNSWEQLDLVPNIVKKLKQIV